MATLKSSKTNSTYNTDTGMMQVPGQAPISPLAPTAQFTQTPVASAVPLPVPTVPLNNTVPIETTSAQQLAIAPVQNQTAGAGLTGFVNNYANNIQALQQQQAAATLAAQGEVAQNKSTLTKAYEKLAGFGDRKQEIYTENNVNELQKQSNTALQSLQAEQEALQSQIENINANKGTFGGSAQRDISEAQRQSSIKQGRLSMTLAFSNQNYDIARQISDRTIEAELEPLKVQMDALKFFYSENKDSLDKAEARQYETASREIQNQYTEQYNNKKAIQDLVIDAASTGAPASVIQQAQQMASSGASVEQVAGLVGRYTSAALNAQAQRASIANTYSTIAERNSAASALGVNPKVLGTSQFKNVQNAQLLKDEINKAIANVQKYGNYERLNGEGKGALDNSRIQLQSLLSTALEQGVVQPGEAASFQKAIGSLNQSSLIRNSVTIGALKSALETANTKINSNASALEGTYGLSRDVINALTGATVLDNQEFDDMSALID